MRAPRELWLVSLTLLAGLGAAAGAQARPSSGADAELGSALSSLVDVAEAGGPVRAEGDDAELVVTPGERVLVDVIVTGGTSAAAARLRDAGMEVRATSAGPPQAVVEGYAPVDELQRLTAVRGVIGVRPVTGFGTDAGAAQSEGDAAHRGPQARVLGATGAGVKVGVVSDSIDQVGTKLAGSQASGDLPAGVSVLVDDPVDPIDEGRAMAEIIYDTAPGITQMAFASGTATGAIGKAASIDALVAAGARIIADDIFYLSEPFFQDGQISQAVDRARDAGVLYLASAGNRARQSYESVPRFGPGDGGLHDFDPGPGVDAVQEVTTVPDGARLTVTLQWDEPWGAATRDIDALLVRADGTALPSAPSGGTDDNLSGARLPAETATWLNTSGAAVAVGLRIQQFAGAASTAPLTRLKYIARGTFGTFAVAEHATNSDAINPDAAAARGALAVAAVRHDEPGLDDPEDFSSRGPKTRLFDATGARLAAPEVRAKPELAGADGVATTVPGFEVFLGTSAATPSAAGVAALALSAKPTLPLSLLRAIMTNPANAIDCTLPGLPDTDCGAGFVQADRIVAQAQDPSPPAVTPTVTPAAPTGANGWYTGDVTVSWAVSDPGSPSEVVSGCGPAAPADGRHTMTCTARSAGGTTAAPDVTIRRDTLAPAPPAITGIAAQISAGAVPAGAGCRSLDTLSGLASCVVSPVDPSPGTHVLTAVATDNAGLTSTSSLVYTVTAPPAQALASPQVQPAAPTPVAAKTTTRTTAKDVVRLASSRRCVRRTTRLKVRILKRKTAPIRSVKVSVTGVKKAKTRKKTGTITLGRLKRKKVTVRVTVTFKDGRKSTIRKKYRRC